LNGVKTVRLADIIMILLSGCGPRAFGLFWKRACANNGCWGMAPWATAKKDGLRSIRKEPKPCPAIGGADSRRLS